MNNVLLGQNVPDNVWIDLVVLIEPKKSDIILFRKTGVLPIRKAEICIYYLDIDNYNRYEVTLNNEKVETVSKPTTLPRTRPTFNYPENDKVVKIVLEDPACRQVLLDKGLTEFDIDNNLYFDAALDSRLDLIKKIYGPNFSDFIYQTTPRPRVVYVTPFWGDGIGPNSTRSYIQPIDLIIFFVNSRTNKVMKIYDTGTNFSQ